MTLSHLFLWLHKGKIGSEHIKEWEHDWNTVYFHTFPSFLPGLHVWLLSVTVLIELRGKYTQIKRHWNRSWGRLSFKSSVTAGSKSSPRQNLLIKSAFLTQQTLICNRMEGIVYIIKGRYLLEMLRLLGGQLQLLAEGGRKERRWHTITAVCLNLKRCNIC